MRYERVTPLPTLAELEERGYANLATPGRQRMRMLVAKQTLADQLRDDAWETKNRETLDRIEESRKAWKAATAAMHPAKATSQRVEALQDVEAVRRAKAEQPIHGRMSNAEIRGLADKRAAIMGERIGALAVALPDDLLLGWLNDQVHRLDARRDAFAFDCGDRAEALRQAMARARCPVWWRRQLRTRKRRLREDDGRRRGEVHARRQIYVTDDTLRDHIEQKARSAAMMEETELESEDGECVALAKLAGAGTSNKAIRRGELMTRIRGCEEWAEAHGMAGLFTTNTTPSRFHANHYGGGRNHRHFGDESSHERRRYVRDDDGVRRLVSVERVRHGNYGPVQQNSPRDGQKWLRKVWENARRHLGELGIPFFGFRVAEPHHDGCPHWHMLLWTAPEHVDRLRAVLRAQWMKDHPTEPGADEHRFKAVAMEKGGAAGYIAKYIAKNIDDAGVVVEGQLDEFAEASRDLYGGNAAKRVEAWASAHGIRQFQPIGQPPIGVWRELRRVEAERAAGASPAVKKAHEAATRGLSRRADWCAYMKAQGGAMTGRDYRVRILTEEAEVVGRYGVTVKDKPLGVIDSARPDEWILSSRREWRPKGAWDRPAAERTTFVPALGVYLGAPRASASAPQARPWTRVNNCTDGGGVAELMRSGLVGLTLRNLEPGGSQTTEEPPWTSSRPSNPLLTPPSRPSSTRSTRSATA